MLNYFNRNYNYKALKEYNGSISQFAGTKRYIFNSGLSKGVEAIDVRNGSGLNFTIIVDRGLDIAWADYKSIPISFISDTGIVSPVYYESRKDEWLRGFYGGLMTTCGLTNVGNPRNLNGEEYGLHGRISYLPADYLSINEYFDGTDYIISISGKIRQSKLFFENLEINRIIKTVVGKNKIVIEDTISNESFNKQPFMILYHCNIGFPLLNKNSNIIIPHNDIEPMYEEMGKHLKEYDTVYEPDNDFEQTGFFFDMKKDKDGFSYAMISNDRKFPELALSIKYNKDILNNFAQYRCFLKKNYGMFFEPCNNFVKGIKDAKEIAALQYLEPQEKKVINLEFEILSDTNEINNKIEYLKNI